MTWHGVAWRGMAWHGVAWRGMALVARTLVAKHVEPVEVPDDLVQSALVPCNYNVVWTSLFSRRNRGSLAAAPKVLGPKNTLKANFARF